MNNYAFLITWMRAKTADERGAGLAEYALLLFLIAVACLLALGALGGQISDVYNQITTALGG